MSNIKLIYKSLSANEYLFFIFRIHNTYQCKLREFFKFYQCDEQSIIYELIELNKLKQFNEKESIDKFKIISNDVFDFVYTPNVKYINSNLYFESRRFKFKE